MIGPLPLGTYTGQHFRTCWESLEAGRSYHVVREFYDRDNDIHQPGESWKFLGCLSNPYDEGISLFVTFDNQKEWQIPLEHSPEEQGVLLDNLRDYIA